MYNIFVYNLYNILNQNKNMQFILWLLKYGLLFIEDRLFLYLNCVHMKFNIEETYPDD